MAGEPTANYDLPTYADSDAPDLTGAYNAAMTAIDAQMKANADAISTMQESIENLQQGNFDPHPESDATLTVQQLSEAKVTASGIVYFKAAE